MDAGPLAQAWIIPGVQGLRRLSGLAVAVLGLVGLFLALAGGIVAGYVGSDDTVFNEPTALGADGRLVLTAPDLLAYDGVQVTLRAEAPRGIFIATAHPVDVADYVGRAPHVRLTRVTRHGVVAEDVGVGTRPLQPASVDFWTRSMTGSGVQELTLDRSTSAAQWVIAPVDGAGPTTVSFGLTVNGSYRVALIVTGLGLLLLVVSVEIWRRPRRPRRTPATARQPYLDQHLDVADRPQGRTSLAPRRRGRHLLGASLALALTVSGCAFDDLVPNPSRSPALATTKAALTEAELPALFESYDARLRAAIKAASPPHYRSRQWHLVEHGPALESDRFGTLVSRRTRLGHRTAYPHEPIAVYSGRFDSYPMWALVASTAREQTAVDLFTKSSVLSPWLRQAGAESAVAAKGLPDPGRATELPGAGASEQSAAARAAWADYLRSGRPGSGLELDQRSREWRENIGDLGSRAMFRGMALEVENAAPAGGPHVVQVADGHLALVVLRVTTRLSGRPHLRVRWNRPYGKYRPSKGGVLSFSHLATGLIHLPEKGPPVLVGSTFSEVAAAPQQRAKPRR